MDSAVNRTFKFLYPAKHNEVPRPDREVLSTYVTLSDVHQGVVVIKDEAKGGVYRAFRSVKELLKWQTGVPEAERDFHEVVFKSRQRLKFDIDAPVGAVEAMDPAILDRIVPGWRNDAGLVNVNGYLEAMLEGRPYQDGDATSVAPTGKQKMEAFMVYFVNLVVDVFTSLYPGQTIASEDIAVASSLGDENAPGKYSYHVMVMPYVVANHFEAKDFTKVLLAEMEEEVPELIRLVDPDVNKSTQNFRMLGSAKSGTNRPKLYSQELADFLYTTVPEPEDSLVGHPLRAVLLPLRVSGESAQASPEEALTDQDVSNVLNMAATQIPVVYGAHRFTRRLGALFMFERKGQSFCTICSRIHTADNSLMLLVKPGEGCGEASVMELCRRAPGKSKFLGTVSCSPGAFPGAPRPRPSATADAESDARLSTQIAEIASGQRDPHRSCDKLFEQLPPNRQHVYDASEMRPFEATSTLVVKAQVGMGKTRQLREYLDREFPYDPNSLARPPVIRFVTFRQSFSESLREAFPEFTLYLDAAAGQISSARSPRLVIQVESLHRLLSDTRHGKCDLLILDEVESVLGQFSSGLHKSFNESFTVFQWLMATSERVICMDANVSDRTFRTLEKFRPREPAFFHWNKFSRALGDTVHVTARKSVWLRRMLKALGENQRIAFASNSLREAKVVLEILQDEYPDKRMKLYSSETPHSEKVAHFADVDKYWSEVDVLAYTPTVSAGVSYERPNHFDCMFLYLSDVSCDVETARQMMGRIRSLRDRAYYVCIRSTRGRYPTDIATLERLSYDRRQLIVADGRQRVPSTSEFDPATGQVRPYRSAFFPLWLETCRITNLSRVDYMARFIDQVADTRAKVVDLVADAGATEDVLKALNKRHKSTKEGLAERDAECVATSLDLTPEEVADIRARQRERTRGEDVTPGERAAVQRYYLRQAYGWHGEMSTDFVRAFADPGLRRIFENLTTILNAPSELEALEELRRREQAQILAVETARSVRGISPQTLSFLEHKDIRRRYRYPGLNFVLWFMYLCGFRSLLDDNGVQEKWMRARLLSIRPRLSKVVASVLHELEVSHPGHHKFYSENDVDASNSILRFINSTLRKMFGLEVRKGRGTDPRYYLRRTKAARQLAWPDDPPDKRAPRVPSSLAPADRSFDAAMNFVLFVYYENMPPAPPPAPSDGPEVPPVDAATAREYISGGWQRSAVPDDDDFFAFVRASLDAG